MTYTEEQCACCQRPKPDPDETDAEMAFMAGLATGFMFIKTGVMPLCSRHARMSHDALSAVDSYGRKTAGGS